MITGASGTTVKNGTVVLKTPGKGGLTYKKENSYVSNIPTLTAINNRYDGKFDSVGYYNTTTGNY